MSSATASTRCSPRPNGALMAPTPLTLAETASVFGEMLTFRALLDSTTDPRPARPCSPPRSRT